MNDKQVKSERLEIQPADIKKVLEDKFEHRKDEDDLGFTGHFKLSPKEVLDVIIELAKANDLTEDARGASELMRLVSTTTVSLGTLLGEVVPENSVLYKDSGTWHFHEDETTFDNHEEPDYTQGVNESFEDFIRRVVEALAKAEIERDDEHMIINTDLAIARSGY